MNERQMQFRVGVVVFATMIIGGLLATLNGPLPTGWLPWGRAKYQIGIEVPEAPGVDPNTPVRKNGILIGRVKSIEDKDGGVLFKAEIDGNRPLFADFEPHIRTSVLGDATIDFLSRRPAAGAQPVADGTVFRGFVDPNPFDSLGQLGDLKEEFGKASQSLAHGRRRSVQIGQARQLGFGRRNRRNPRASNAPPRYHRSGDGSICRHDEILQRNPRRRAARLVHAARRRCPTPAAGAQPPADGQQLRQRFAKA